MGNPEDGPASAIHIPSSFDTFVSLTGTETCLETDPSQTRESPPMSATQPSRARAGSSPSQTSQTSQASEATIAPESPEQEPVASRVSVLIIIYIGSTACLSAAQRNPPITSPINTSIPPESPPGFGKTPRASTRQEADEEFRRKNRLSKSLEGKRPIFAEWCLLTPADIAESDDGERPEGEFDSESDTFEDEARSTSMSSALEGLSEAQHEEINALKNALGECWTLCNTLAGLSSSHRERMFSFANTGDMQEQAWRSCWRLCQNLYEHRDADVTKHVTQTLELCRDFCMALFDARQRNDESLDSILRVSFELNNHLYNTHDRNLAPAFKERTLDFYITMCHRLMKQRTSLPEETDSLLRSCWALAENLFSLRQNTRENKPAEEDLLSSAVQACWDLCDLFREGWTQIRPDRGTPRPASRRRRTSDRDYDSRASSTAGSSVGYAAQQMLPPSRPTSSTSLRNQTLSAQFRQFPPETPTTLFDETTDSPAGEPAVPNIMVLGPSERSPPQTRHWSSSASQSSQRSNSTTTSTQNASVSGSTPRASAYADPNAEPHLPRLKALILKAAMNAGYNRASPQSLQNFVKGMSPNAFGTEPWRKEAMEQYRRLVLGDPSFKPGVGGLPSGRKTAPELGRAVMWLSRREEFDWLRDLYRIVFGFSPEDAHAKGKVWIQT